jgi:precorrin-3B methylase
MSEDPFEEMRRTFEHVREEMAAEMERAREEMQREMERAREEMERAREGDAGGNGGSARGNAA